MHTFSTTCPYANAQIGVIKALLQAQSREAETAMAADIARLRLHKQQHAPPLPQDTPSY
jgi:hypothetical protein